MSDVQVILLPLSHFLLIYVLPPLFRNSLISSDFELNAKFRFGTILVLGTDNVPIKSVADSAASATLMSTRVALVVLGSVMLLMNFHLAWEFVDVGADSWAALSLDPN